MNVGRLLTRNAERSPERSALLYEERSVSFRELDRRSNRVAHALEGSGVTKGDRVALLSMNRPEWAEVFFGAAKAGAVLVPINFRLEERELTHILEHAAPKLVIHENALVTPEGIPRLGFESDYETWLEKADPSAPTVELTETDPHSICYTSGTTGFPKGAVLTHANVVIGTHYYSVSNVGYTREDVFLNPTPLCHRAGWARLIQSIGMGAPQVLLRKFDPEKVFDLVARHRVTMSGFIPTMVRLMAEHRTKADVSSMRILLTTGEACPPATKATIFELFPGVQLIMSFASTEAGIMALLSSKDDRAPQSATGRPLPEVELRTEGEDSEIAIRTGAPGTGGVMLEYWNDPEANDAAFDGDWFRTGDCGHLDEAGYLFVTDRKKDMILSGGLNVYSKEVESCLLEHPDVVEAAVIGKTDPVYGEAVVAFAVRRGDTLTEAALVEHVKKHLASYKKPKEIRFVDALPHNTAGKILKYELRKKLEEKPS